ncbi:MAG TPA: hypothetical protein VFC24_12570 [Casimicrobiaceae bacterium]|nr:hypothetical protein [Casimicrobiaceae bacterium]
MHKQVVAVRCFAEETAGQWEAHCVDLGLAVKGDSLESVKAELDHLIHQHIDDKIATRSTARELPPQRRDGTPARSPIALRMRYWGLYLAGRLGLRTDALRDDAMRRRAGYRPHMAARSLR